MLCPRCAEPLAPLKEPYGLAHRCATCGGEALTMPVVRRRVAGPEANAIWKGTRGEGVGGGPSAPCPTCTRPMTLVTLGEAGETLTLDGCERCLVVWFDTAELARLEAPPPPPAPPGLNPRQAEAHVAMKMTAALETGAFDAPHVEEGPAVAPWRRNRLWLRLGSAPWMSLLIAVLLLATSLTITVRRIRARDGGVGATGRALVEDYAFDGRDPLRRGGLTLVSSFFVETEIGRYSTRRRESVASWGWMLLVFAGFLLELRLGRLAFLALLFGGHAVALLAHVVTGAPRVVGLIGPWPGVACLLGWATVVLGRGFKSSRRLTGPWWERWHGGPTSLGPWLVLGFGLWFVWNAVIVLTVSWQDASGLLAKSIGSAASGLLGLLLGLATLRRVGTGPPPSPSVADGTSTRG